MDPGPAWAGCQPGTGAWRTVARRAGLCKGEHDGGHRPARGGGCQARGQAALVPEDVKTARGGGRPTRQERRAGGRPGASRILSANMHDLLRMEDTLYKAGENAQKCTASAREVTDMLRGTGDPLCCALADRMERMAAESAEIEERINSLRNWTTTDIREGGSNA